MSKSHSFHIPVMGIGYTADTPLKVSQFGIDSVISLVDDILLEKLRKVYSNKFKIPYQEISDKIDDSRAKRITSYLDMMHHLTEKKFTEFKESISEKAESIKDYFNLLPDTSLFKNEYFELKSNSLDFTEIKRWFNKNISMGSVDVNIMTKIDKESYRKGIKQNVEYNEAHAALRGFAQSKLDSAVVLSAGMNPRLYNYMEQFDDFYPDKNGYIKKRIIIKVSDYRSALIQGKYFAKKGLWVSEYRIESGLNCGGHAFATEGYLLGPVLEEFSIKRGELSSEMGNLFMAALKKKGLNIPDSLPETRITAQGGVGTAEEHRFLMEKYNLDSVGWGTPFLLVPEATTVDENTMKLLSDAREKDLFLSNISPLGVLFNSLRGNTKDEEKEDRIFSGKPGSPCPRGYLAFDKQYNDKGLCTASARFQRIKIAELDNMMLEPSEYSKRYKKITEKSCICVGLGTSTQIVHNIDIKKLGYGVSVCPGPNMAYFSGKLTLKNMIDHIYGKANVILRNDRPHMFIKELKMYLDFLQDKIDEQNETTLNKNQEKYFMRFRANLADGIRYYKEMFESFKDEFTEMKESVLWELQNSNMILEELNRRINRKIPAPVLS